MDIKFNEILNFTKIDWEEIPDLGLYSEQIVSFINDKLRVFNFDDDKLLTSSMVNNYVKMGLIPKPVKKKYYREHIAYLMVISILKPVLSIKDIQKGIALQLNIFNVKIAFNEFMNILNSTLEELIFVLEKKEDIFRYKGFSAKFENVSLTIAIHAFCFQIFTKIILEKEGFYNKGDKNE